MPQNITSLSELDPHIHVGATFKISDNGGRTWTFVKVVRATAEHFSNGSQGYQAAAEVNQDGVHGVHALTDRMFRAGAIVRVATPEEVRGKRWSYER